MTAPAERMTEAQLQHAVLDCARLLGWQAQSNS
jgi:hypothetical protein